MLLCLCLLHPGLVCRASLHLLAKCISTMPKWLPSVAAATMTCSAGRLQAWYREGCAARELGLWNDAAQAFFRGYQTDPSNQELAGAFQAAVERGKQAHAAALGATAH